MKLGAIEAGGTKFVVCIGNEKGEVLERESFPTEAPEKTMENVFKFFDNLIHSRSCKWNHLQETRSFGRCINSGIWSKLIE
mgnify:CR=1 FL=1